MTARRRTALLLLSAAFLVLLAAGLSLWWWWWRAPAGAEPWEVLVTEADPRVAPVRARAKVRRGVIEDVLAGRLALREAAARFRELNAQYPPVTLDRLRKEFGGGSE